MNVRKTSVRVQYTYYLNIHTLPKNKNPHIRRRKARNCGGHRNEEEDLG
jgi:hypothetical protein